MLPPASPEVSPESRIHKKGLILVLAIMGTLALFLVASQRRNIGPAIRRMNASNRIHQIILALHNYESHYGELPPAILRDDSGRPLHSWRVLILPFAGHQELYSRIDLTLPWHDPKNQAVGAITPELYTSEVVSLPKGFTNIRAIADEDGFLHPSRGRSLREITDAMNTTVVAVIECDHPWIGHWMNPQDMDIDSFDQWHLSENALHEGDAVIGYANAAVVLLPLAESNTYHAEFSWNNKRWLATISDDDDPPKESTENKNHP